MPLTSGLVKGAAHAEDANGRFRPTMEDRCLIMDPLGPLMDPAGALLAVFDGHGGSAVADFAASNMPQNILRAMQCAPAALGRANCTLY